MKALGIGVTQGEDGPRRVRKTERCVEGVQGGQTGWRHL